LRILTAPTIAGVAAFAGGPFILITGQNLTLRGRISGPSQRSDLRKRNLDDAWT